MDNIFFKSAKSFVLELASQFDYTDFTPPINSKVLKARLKQVLSSNAYWEEFIASDKLNDWIFIKIKSFQHWEPIVIGFLLKGSTIIQVIYDEFEVKYGNLSKSHWKNEIDLREVWRDHKHLFDGFWEVIDKSLKYSNRAKEDDQFTKPHVNHQ